MIQLVKKTIYSLLSIIFFMGLSHISIAAEYPSATKAIQDATVEFKSSYVNPDDLTPTGNSHLGNNSNYHQNSGRLPKTGETMGIVLPIFGVLMVSLVGIKILKQERE